MLPDRVSNPGPLTYESGALPIALCGPASDHRYMYLNTCSGHRYMYLNTSVIMTVSEFNALQSGPSALLFI